MITLTLTAIETQQLLSMLLNSNPLIAKIIAQVQEQQNQNGKPIDNLRTEPAADGMGGSTESIQPARDAGAER